MMPGHRTLSREEVSARALPWSDGRRGAVTEFDLLRCHRSIRVLSCCCSCCCCCAHTLSYHRVSSLFFFPYRVDGLLLFHRIPENKTNEYQPTHTHTDTRAHSTQHTAQHSTAHTHKIKSIKKKNGAISIPRQARSAGRNPSRYRSPALYRAAASCYSF
jgi:hypothetical protein